VWAPRFGDKGAKGLHPLEDKNVWMGKRNQGSEYQITWDQGVPVGCTKPGVAEKKNRKEKGGRKHQNGCRTLKVREGQKKPRNVPRVDYLFQRCLLGGNP